MPFIILSAAHENISKVFLKTIATKNCSNILGVFPRTPNTRRQAHAPPVGHANFLSPPPNRRSYVYTNQQRGGLNIRRRGRMEEEGREDGELAFRFS